MHRLKKRFFKKLLKTSIIYIAYLIIICAIVVNYHNHEKIETPTTDKNIIETIQPYDYKYYVLDYKTNPALKELSNNSVESYTALSSIYEDAEEAEDLEETTKTEEYTIIKDYDVPAGHSFKSYTNYKLLSASSKQGQLQETAYTGETGIRMVDDYYCAALGTYYEGQIGDKYLVTLSTGNQFKMILCDVKDDRHTDANHQFTRTNGCVIEFYVDYSVLDSSVKRMGNISYIDGFEGEIVLIQKIQE